MLTLDIVGLAESELRKAIASYCSECGTVKVVKILLPSDKSEYAVATVTMATPAGLDLHSFALTSLPPRVVELPIFMSPLNPGNSR